MRWNNALLSKSHIVFVAAFLLGLVFPFAAAGQGNNDIVGNVEKRTWVKIPKEYHAKINELVATNSVMKNFNLLKFTEDFIVNQMEQDWWISKENQLLFGLSAVYEKLTNNELYDGSDGDDFRLEEFGNAIDNVIKCWDDYAKLINIYIDELSADVDRRSANVDRRSADVDRRSLDATNKWLNELIVFYDLYKQNPNNVKNEELEQAINHSKWIIASCKELWIDYKNILPEEVRRFYWIE